MTTSLDEVIEFLEIASSKGFINDNTASARRTACVKFFDILEPDQKNVEYVKNNLEIIKTRFTNLYKDVRGNTVEEYGRRVALVINEFIAWKTDRAAWERDVSARQSSRPANDGEKKAKPKAEPRASADSGAQRQENPSPDARTVTFPIRPDFELQVKLPRDGLTVQELKKLIYFLLPYAPDWEPSEAPRTVFPMLERDDSRAA
jgi:hypothetical protein